MSNFKLGFIGAGFIANFQAKAVAQIRGVDITGVYSLKGAEEFVANVKALGVGDCASYSSIDELCRNVDAVAIFAPNYVRIDIMKEIAVSVKAGAALKGIICEKPLGRTVAEARQLVALAKEAGIPTAYFENQIHMKGIRAQMQQLAPVQAQMGPLALSRSAEEHCGPHEPWFWNPIQQGGGVLSDMGCHSIAVGWFVLTPTGKPITFLKPVAVSAVTSLLKWGVPKYRQELLDRTGVDYSKTPAEDFATGMVTFQNPETGQLVQAQFTNSWMYDKQGLRLLMDGLGPGYAFELNTLRSSLEVFTGDQAAESVADSETALEKSTASRGLLTVETNEPDLYGYVDEIKDAVACFQEGKDGFLNFEYGFEITRLCQAAYMSAERGVTIDLTDPKIQEELESYVSLIAQGKGADLLYGKK
ncbi:MAG: 1,5-anhydro-D-fructose reductase [Candidatus Hydrogenedentes bacterium ADurb.Bin170]|nr:MAG: 1,5-anhydro-D-fructose reductase [Candidatus Hydrogenedentes bacterium ADurb.Bin170]